MLPSAHFSTAGAANRQCHRIAWLSQHPAVLEDAVMRVSEL